MWIGLSEEVVCTGGCQDLGTGTLGGQTDWVFD